MTLLKDVKIIDSDNHIVRIGSGAVWGDVAKALQGYDLGISSGDTKSVGVGGLTLGGGIGWMVRNHGLSIDHLVGAEIVTADGNILQLSETENQDLFWAIRGGGGNFGIVTHFDFKAYPLNKVVAGTIQYELDNLQNLLTKYRDIMRNSPEELNTSVLIMPSFGPQMPAAVNVVVCYSGQLEDADSVINPLRNLGDVVLDNVQEKNYYEVLEEGHPPQGVKIVSKNTFFDDFSDKIIQDISNIYTSNNPPVMQIRYLKGLINRIDENATAFSHRNAEIFLMYAAFFPPDTNDEDIQNSMKPYYDLASFGSGTYLNLLNVSTEEDIKMAYPEKVYKKLAKIKRDYDPENIFNRNSNIKPEGNLN